MCWLVVRRFPLVPPLPSGSTSAPLVPPLPSISTSPPLSTPSSLVPSLPLWIYPPLMSHPLRFCPSPLLPPFSLMSRPSPSCLVPPPLVPPLSSLPPPPFRRDSPPPERVLTHTRSTNSKRGHGWLRAPPGRRQRSSTRRQHACVAPGERRGDGAAQSVRGSSRGH